MPRKAGSRADTNISACTGQDPTLPDIKVAHFFLRSLVCLGKDIHPFPLGSIGSFPVSGLPLGRAA